MRQLLREWFWSLWGWRFYQIRTNALWLKGTTLDKLPHLKHMLTYEVFDTQLNLTIRD